ncbi:hypothetical protein CHUAL_009493 [Chamberlinius hualienensis]
MLSNHHSRQPSLCEVPLESIPSMTTPSLVLHTPLISSVLPIGMMPMIHALFSYLSQLYYQLGMQSGPLQTLAGDLPVSQHVLWFSHCPGCSGEHSGFLHLHLTI